MINPKSYFDLTYSPKAPQQTRVRDIYPNPTTEDLRLTPPQAKS